MPLSDYLDAPIQATSGYAQTITDPIDLAPNPTISIHVYGDRMRDLWLDTQAAIASPEPGEAFLANYTSYRGGAGNVLTNLYRFTSYDPIVTVEDLTSHTPHVRLRITSPTSPTLRYNYVDELGGYDPTRTPNNPNPNIVVISDYCKGAITTLHLERIARTFGSANYVLIDTKNPHLYRPYISPTCNLVFTPNEKEYALNRLFYRSTPTVIIKQGSRGATILRDGTRSEAVPTSPIPNPLSTVGAGDVFIAALAAILAASNPPLPAAVAFANQAARSAIANSIHTCLAPYQAITSQVPIPAPQTATQEIQTGNAYYTTSSTTTSALRAESMGGRGLVCE